MAKAPLSLNVQHDYISLKTPNGVFTRGRYGSKASGELARNDKAFNAIESYINDALEHPGANLGEIMNKLTDEKVMTSLWPEWNAAPKLLPPVGSNVICPMRPKYGTGEVKYHKGKYAYVLFPGQQAAVGFEAMMLEIV